MHEIESNKHAWGQLSADHYRTFKAALAEGRHQLNRYIQAEVGDLTGKRVIHLQCNTGADTLLLAGMGAAHVTGVDLVPGNVVAARQLAEDFACPNVDFIESDIMTLMANHPELAGQYDVVFVSEGAIGWLPDLALWGRTVRYLLSDGGYAYVFEGHPTFLMFDEGRLAHGEYNVKYPYFGREPDVDNSIGGYAGETKTGVQAYFWMNTLSEIINSLINAGLRIEFFNEFPENFYDSGGQERVDAVLWNFPFNDGRFPQSFSLKATATG
ncbi:MAG: class I SAM-dependent methyltransferase [Promicromonosporaceae bacterium]|nr:class I SAM-dependent methyltransferase [Promicromonosporaceae bacterium]